MNLKPPKFIKVNSYHNFIIFLNLQLARQKLNPPCLTIQAFPSPASLQPTSTFPSDNSQISLLRTLKLLQITGQLVLIMILFITSCLCRKYLNLLFKLKMFNRLKINNTRAQPTQPPARKILRAHWLGLMISPRV